jgi:methyl-accepting chemotaxis protein
VDNASGLNGALGRLSVALKLAVLVGIGLLVSGGVALTAALGSARVDAADGRAATLARADAELYHLDNRNSELKVDAYRAIVDDNRRQVQSDAADDIASVEERLAELEALAIPQLRNDVAALRPRIEANNAFVTAFIADAVAGGGVGGRVPPRRDRGQQPQPR